MFLTQRHCHLHQWITVTQTMDMTLWLYTISTQQAVNHIV